MFPSYQNYTLNEMDRVKKRVIKAFSKKYSDTEQMLIEGDDLTIVASGNFITLEKKMLLLISLILEAKGDIEQENDPIQLNNIFRNQGESDDDDDDDDSLYYNQDTSSSEEDLPPPRFPPPNRPVPYPTSKKRKRDDATEEFSKRRRLNPVFETREQGYKKPNKDKRVPRNIPDRRTTGLRDSLKEFHEYPVNKTGSKRKATDEYKRVSKRQRTDEAEIKEKRERIVGPFSAPYEKFRYDLLPQPTYSGGNRYTHTNIFTGILQSILTVMNDLNTIIDQFSDSFNFLTADQVFKLM